MEKKVQPWFFNGASERRKSLSQFPGQASWSAVGGSSLKPYRQTGDDPVHLLLM